MAEFLKAIGIYYPNELRSIRKNCVKLQPVYEAFTNAWESILEKYTAEKLNLGSIIIKFYYNVGMFEDDNENNSKILQKITIIDNGVGLNEESFKRLLNLRDNSKSKNNKGTGRIQYLHYFDDTIFESVYKVDGNNFHKIRLTLSKKDSFLQSNAILRKEYDCEIDIENTYTNVELQKLLDSKNDAKFYNSLLLSDVKSELIIHFLSRLCESRELLPKIKLVRYENEIETESLTITNQDVPMPDQSVELEAHYSKLDKKNNVQEIEKTEKFTLLAFVLPENKLKRNSIFFVSNGALTHEEKIDGLHKDDVIEGNRYMFLLRGNYFNEIEDDLRGNLHLVKEAEFKKQSEGNLFPEECLLVETIKNSTNLKIASLYDKLQEKREQAILNLEQLQNMFHLDDDAIKRVKKSLKSSDTDEQILRRIYEADTEVTAKRDAEIKKRFEYLKTLTPTDDNYQEKLSQEVNDFVKLIPLQNRTNVTKHIARRKLVLEIFDMIMNKELEKLEQGGRVDEDLLHNLIFQQHSTNTKDSDLWLLDDQYLYFDGCSERFLDKIEVAGEKLIKEELTEEELSYKIRQIGDKIIDVGHRRPDVLLYPNEGKCIIIEFKAPDVDVSKYLAQINKYALVINNLSNEKFKIRAFYGYIIGENIEYDFIQENDSSFKQSPNLKYIFRPSYKLPGKFGRESGDLYTEIIKYSDILKRAKLRNRILMEKLDENKINE